MSSPQPRPETDDTDSKNHVEHTTATTHRDTLPSPMTTENSRAGIDPGIESDRPAAPWTQMSTRQLASTAITIASWAVLLTNPLVHMMPPRWREALRSGSSTNKTSVRVCLDPFMHGAGYINDPPHGDDGIWLYPNGPLGAAMLCWKVTPDTSVAWVLAEDSTCRTIVSQPTALQSTTLCKEADRATVDLGDGSADGGSPVQMGWPNGCPDPHAA